MSGSATPVIAQIVETMRALAGLHPGFRPVHAKGIVCFGTFSGAREARAVSRAPHLQGQSVPTVIRFANASGNPGVHDGVANTRAIAAKFQLAEGKNADILAHSIEGFRCGHLRSFSPSCERSSRTRSPASQHPMRSPAFSRLTPQPALHWTPEAETGAG